MNSTKLEQHKSEQGLAGGRIEKGEKNAEYFIVQELCESEKGEKNAEYFIVQELCESRGGRPGLSVLTSLLVSVDVKLY